jgi:hypothetical protein
MGWQGGKIDFLETQPRHLTNAKNTDDPDSKHTCKRVSTQITSYTEVLKNAGLLRLPSQQLVTGSLGSSSHPNRKKPQT